MLGRTGLRDEIGADNVFVSIRSAIATCTLVSVTLHRFPSVNQAGARQHRPRAGGAGRASHLLIFISGPTVALRVSNWVAIGMLFLTSYIFVRSTGHRPLPLGCTTVLVRALLTGVAIGLGG
jgi:hypothetical protein